MATNSNNQDVNAQGSVAVSKNVNGFSVYESPEQSAAEEAALPHYKLPNPTHNSLNPVDTNTMDHPNASTSVASPADLPAVDDRYIQGADVAMDDDKGTLSANRTYGVMSYRQAAENAGLSKQQINQNIQSLETLTDSEASSNNLSQNTFDAKAQGSMFQILNDQSTTGSGLSKSGASVAAAGDLARLHDILVSGKNALKYDATQKGLAPDQVLDVLHKQQAQDDNNLHLNASTSGASTSARTSDVAVQSGAATAPSSNQALYANQISVKKGVGKDGKSTYKFTMDSKSRLDVGANGQAQNVKGQPISRKTFDKILKANGYKPLTNAQLNSAIKANRPLVNGADNVAFNGQVQNGKVKTSSIQKSNKAFNGKHEKQLEAKATSTRKGFSSAPKATASKAKTTTAKAKKAKAPQISR